MNARSLQRSGCLIKAGRRSSPGGSRIRASFFLRPPQVQEASSKDEGAVPASLEGSSGPPSSSAISGVRRISPDSGAVLSEISAGLAHDMNNVLGGILGNAQLMLHDICSEGLPDKHRVNEFVGMLEEISTLSLLGSGICQRVLDLSGHERGSRVFRVLEMADHIVRFARMRAGRELASDGAVAIAVSMMGDPTARTNPSEILVCGMNLVTNAIHHGRIPGRQLNIELSGWEGEERTYLSVMNDGKQIPLELRSDLLQRPVHGDGNGLGLYTSASNLRDCGCDLTFTSTPHRTAFVIDMPKPL